MPLARVALTRGPASHSFRNRKFVRGIPQTVTSQRDIDYYRSEYGFTVTELGGGSAKKTQQSEPKAPKIYSEKQLNTKTKKKLTVLAGKVGAELTGQESKQELIDAVLCAQDVEEVDDDDDDDDEE